MCDCLFCELCRTNQTSSTRKTCVLKSKEVGKQHFLQNLDYQSSDATIKIFGVSTESSCRYFGFSIETLIEEITPAVSERDEFEHRDKSIILPHFRQFGL